MQNFTSTDLLLYIFDEAQPSTRLAIERALQKDSLLQEEFTGLQQTIFDVENYQLQPHDKIIENILSEFSEKEAHAV